MRDLCLFLCAISSTVFLVCRADPSLAVGPSVLITGANRGIGLALVAELAKTDSVKHIFAGCRKLNKTQFEKDLESMIASIDEYKNDPIEFEKKHAKKYRNMAKNKEIVAKTVQESNVVEKIPTKTGDSFKIGNVTVELVELDVGDDHSITKAHEHVKYRLYALAEHLKYGDKPRLDLLINNAGMMQTPAAGKSNENSGFDPINPDRNVFMDHFRINTMGSVMTTSKFLPLLRGSGEKEKRRRLKTNTNKISGVVFISSTTSSMGNYMGRRSHNNEAYPLSKAALNHYMKSIADPLYTNKELISLSICPGWVATDMGNSVPASDTTSLLSVEKATTQMVDRIKTFNLSDSGKFYSRYSQETKHLEFGVLPF